MNRQDRSPKIVPPEVGSAARSASCALLWAAWACIGPIRPGPLARTAPAGDVLWALPVLGLVQGVLWTVLFAGAWRIFGEYPVGLRLVPVLVLLLADLFMAGRFTMAGVRAVETLAYHDDALLSSRRRDITAIGTIAAVVIVLATYALLLAIPKGIEWWPADWRHHLHWMYPRPIFRPLLLVPMWTCWSMVLAAGTGRALLRPRDTDDPIDVSSTVDDESQPEMHDPASNLAGRATPAQIIIGFLPAMVLTAVYASRDMNMVIGMGVSLVVFLFAYLAAMAAALRWRGQTGITILAAGLVGRMAFLACWLFIGRALHGW